MRTVAEPVDGTEVRVEPSETPGITINGVPATLDAVAKADARVDLASTGSPGVRGGRRPPAERRSFVVEHVLGPLGLRGVTAADVTGVREEWDFARPEHRFCYAARLGPENVVGHPKGLPNPALAKAIGEVDVIETGEAARTTVTTEVALSNDHGDVRIAPREFGAGVRFDVRYGDATFACEVDPAGSNDERLIESVTTSTTPFLSPTEAEAVVHSIADLVSDVLVIGGFDDLVVEAELGEAYHELTVGVARKAWAEGAAVEREN